MKMFPGIGGTMLCAPPSPAPACSQTHILLSCLWWRLFVSAGLSPPHDERKARVLRVWWGVSSAVTGDVCKCGDARAALCVQCGRWM